MARLIIIHWFTLQQIVIDMIKYSLIFMIVFAFCQCSKFPNEKRIYYFYNAKELFKRYVNKTDTHYYNLNYSITIPYARDSFRVGSGGISYMLVHYPNLNLHDILFETDQPCRTQTLLSGNIIVRDTLFVKHKSVLDTIDYFDSKWIKEEGNLKKFWAPVKYRGGSFYDSLRIYTIEPIEGTDSLIFRRVHRDFFQAID